MKTSSAKNKGRRLQQWACQQISELTGFPWGRGDEDAPISSRPMGQSGTDVRLESQVLKEFPWSVECKYQETWSVPAWIKQAQANQKPGTDWLLIIKRNRTEPVVVLNGWRFFEILQEYGEMVKDERKRKGQNDSPSKD